MTPELRTTRGRRRASSTVPDSRRRGGRRARACCYLTANPDCRPPAPPPGTDHIGAPADREAVRRRRTDGRSPIRALAAAVAESGARRVRERLDVRRGGQRLALMGFARRDARRSPRRSLGPPSSSRSTGDRADVVRSPRPCAPEALHATAYKQAATDRALDRSAGGAASAPRRDRPARTGRRAAAPALLVADPRRATTSAPFTGPTPLVNHLHPDLHEPRRARRAVDSVGARAGLPEHRDRRRRRRRAARHPRAIEELGDRASATRTCGARARTPTTRASGGSSRERGPLNRAIRARARRWISSSTTTTRCGPTTSARCSRTRRRAAPRSSTARSCSTRPTGRRGHRRVPTGEPALRLAARSQHRAMRAVRVRARGGPVRRARRLAPRPTHAPCRRAVPMVDESSVDYYPGSLWRDRMIRFQSPQSRRRAVAEHFALCRGGPLVLEPRPMPRAVRRARSSGSLGDVRCVPLANATLGLMVGLRALTGPPATPPRGAAAVLHLRGDDRRRAVGRP